MEKVVRAAHNAAVIKYLIIKIGLKILDCRFPE